MIEKRTDSYTNPAGEVVLITPLGHGSIRLDYHDMVIFVDPYGEAYDFSGEPAADLVLITHDHYDHLDPSGLAPIVADKTYVIASELTRENYTRVDRTLSNGDRTEWNGVGIEAVPAYNIRRFRHPGEPFHPKGHGNGYILDFNGLRVYIAGDTEVTPEMREIVGIEVAFLPQMLPYTMDFDELVEAVEILRPRVLYPYHYTEIDLAYLRRLFPEITVR